MINLKHTLLGGQAFNWDYKNGEYIGFFQNKIIKIQHNATSFDKETSKILRLNADYSKILSTIRKDNHIEEAINRFPNLRILKQPFEQTLLSYILSSMNNIKRIRLIVRNIRDELGEDGLFPATDVIAKTLISKLRELGTGFRAKYLKETAKILTSTNLSKVILDMDEETARKTLVDLPGVGPKIADCTLLYSLSFDNVIPLDVWCTRVLVDLYGLDPKMKYTDMSAWAGEYFEGYAGWAGQFLFEYIRNR